MCFYLEFSKKYNSYNLSNIVEDKKIKLMQTTCVHNLHYNDVWISAIHESASDPELCWNNH